MRRPVPLHEDSGLVSFECLVPYLRENPENYPLRPQAGWEHHHVYFQFATWAIADGYKESQRDVLNDFKNNAYNQVHMPYWDEDDFHLDHEEEVPFVPLVSAEKSLVDFELFDHIGAAALGFNLSVNPDINYVVDRFQLGPRKSVDLSPADRADLFDEILTRKLDALGHLEITPTQVAASIIKRTAINLQDSRLHSVANELQTSAPFYPIRPLKHGTLQSISNLLLNAELKVAQAA